MRVCCWECAILCECCTCSSHTEATASSCGDGLSGGFPHTDILNFWHPCLLFPPCSRLFSLSWNQSWINIRNRWLLVLTNISIRILFTPSYIRYRLNSGQNLTVISKCATIMCIIIIIMVCIKGNKAHRFGGPYSARVLSPYVIFGTAQKQNVWKTLNELIFTHVVENLSGRCSSSVWGTHKWMRATLVGQMTHNAVRTKVAGSPALSSPAIYLLTIVKNARRRLHGRTIRTRASTVPKSWSYWRHRRFLGHHLVRARSLLL